MAVARVDVIDPGRQQPGPPVVPRVVVQQGLMLQVGRRAQRLRAPQQIRAADREPVLGQELGGLDPGPAAGAVADADIDVIAAEIDQLVVGVDPHFDVGMALAEAAQPRHQPLGRE